MDIFIPSRKQAKIEQRGAFRNIKGKVGTAKEYPVEVQYTKEELERIGEEGICIRRFERRQNDLPLPTKFKGNISCHERSGLFANLFKPTSLYATSFPPYFRRLPYHLCPTDSMMIPKSEGNFDLIVVPPLRIDELIF